MGWKIAILISPLDTDLQAIVDDIYGAKQLLAPCALTAKSAIYPPDHSQRYAVAHDGLAWLFDWNGIDASFRKARPSKRTIGTFALHSVVNGYGFSIQKDGAFVRSRSGTADNGIIIDEGEPLPVERALVTAMAKPGQGDRAWAAWTVADESFDGEFDDLTHDTIAEDIVFGVMETLTGFRLDQDTPATAAFEASRVMQLNPVKPKSLLDRLLGRA